MKKANNMQTKIFEKTYCKSHDDRIKMKELFQLYIESYEDVWLETPIKSSASGNRKIHGAFMIFKVVDKTKNIEYFPIFSESVGRKLANYCELKIPPKMTIFTTESNSSKTRFNKNSDSKVRNKENKEMLQLIVLSRSMMLLNATQILPMVDPFKRIYDKLHEHPNYIVFENDIKTVNSAIENFINSEKNQDYNKFTNLEDYINLLQKNSTKKVIKEIDFSCLKEKLKKSNPEIQLFF